MIDDDKYYPLPGIKEFPYLKDELENYSDTDKESLQIEQDLYAKTKASAKKA